MRQVDIGPDIQRVLNDLQPIADRLVRHANEFNSNPIRAAAFAVMLDMIAELLRDDLNKRLREQGYPLTGDGQAGSIDAMFQKLRTVMGGHFLMLDEMDRH